MLLARVDVPVTVRLDEPAVLVMPLPDAMLKLATVCADCRSQIAALVMTTSVDDDKLPVRINVPALMLVSPVKVLAALKVSVPAPVLVN